MSLPKLNLSHDAQILVAFLSSVGVIGTQVLHAVGGMLPGNWVAIITSVLATVAGIAGFIKRNEPLIDDADKYL